jgi:hypothetical protein
MAHHTGISGMPHTCSIVTTTSFKSCADMIDTTTSTSTTAPLPHTTTRLVRRDP